MICCAERHNQLEPAEGKSGTSSICAATLAGSIIGDYQMDTTPLKEKYCPRCKKIKPAEGFYFDKNRSHQLRHYCISCSKEIALNYRKAYPARHRRYYRHSRQKRKRKVLTHYGNNVLACVRCGESRLACLTIDHIHGGGRKHFARINKYGSRFYSWLMQNNYPVGYQTLCGNCQLIKREENNEIANKIQMRPAAAKANGQRIR